MSCAETHDAEGMCACVAWLLVSTCAADLWETGDDVARVRVGGWRWGGLAVDG